MMMKNNRPSVGLQGGSSLIVIFGVLCLVVFSVLTLSSALAGNRLETASVNATTAYYEADCKAEEEIARLREEGKSGSYSFEIPVTDTQTLEVELEIDGNSYKIVKYQTKYTASWESDDSLLLWDGN